MGVLQRAFIGGTVLLLATATAAGAREQTSIRSHRGASLHASPAKMATKTVHIIDSGGSFVFKPKSITVKVGTKVIWKNMSSAPHTITGNKQVPFKVNRSIGVGKTISVTFKKTGTFNYHCSIHPFMHGKVTVK